MADTNEDQPQTLKELLKMQAETHKLVQQMAQDIRRVKNEMGLWDVTKQSRTADKVVVNSSGSRRLVNEIASVYS